MEDSCLGFFILLIIIVIIIWISNDKSSRKKDLESTRTRHQSNNSQSRHSNENQISSRSPTFNQPNSNVGQLRSVEKTNYYPQTQIKPKPKIQFKNIQTISNFSPDNELSELHDALTGAPINEKLGLYQCGRCKVYYHRSSYNALVEVNSSLCVSCKSSDIKPVDKYASSKIGKDYVPSNITLINYKEHVGQVVTFEGYVYNVFESRRGNDFAVMFENKKWTDGFKLVFFRGVVNEMGGRGYVNSLKGKRIKVRGLIKKDPTFGYEIVVTDEDMVLQVFK